MIHCLLNVNKLSNYKNIRFPVSVKLWANADDTCRLQIILQEQGYQHQTFWMNLFFPREPLAHLVLPEISDWSSESRWAFSSGFGCGCAAASQSLCLPESKIPESLFHAPLKAANALKYVECVVFVSVYRLCVSAKTHTKVCEAVPVILVTCQRGMICTNTDTVAFLSLPLYKHVLHLFTQIVLTLCQRKWTLEGTVPRKEETVSNSTTDILKYTSEQSGLFCSSFTSKWNSDLFYSSQVVKEPQNNCCYLKI